MKTRFSDLFFRHSIAFCALPSFFFPWNPFQITLTRDVDFPKVEIDINSIKPYQFEPILNQSESQDSEDESDSDLDFYVNTD